MSTTKGNSNFSDPSPYAYDEEDDCLPGHASKHTASIGGGKEVSAPPSVTTGYTVQEQTSNMPNGPLSVESTAPKTGGLVSFTYSGVQDRDPSDK